MELTPQIAIQAIGLVLSAIAGYGAAKFTRGRDSNRLDALEKLTEARDEVLHSRLNRVQSEFNAAMEKLDARSILLLERHSELKGLILGSGIMAKGNQNA